MHLSSQILLQWLIQKHSHYHKRSDENQFRHGQSLVYFMICLFWNSKCISLFDGYFSVYRVMEFNDGKAADVPVL